MPSSRRAGQYEPPFVTPTHPTTGSEVRMAHSGAWVGCEGPGEPEAQVAGPAQGEDPWIRTSEVRKQGQFVTVVEVEKDGEETAESTCHAWRATTQPVPRPAPRGFVTVVAVGTNTDTSLHLDHSGNLALDSNVKLHMELPGAADADYVNQETIDRERKAAEELQRDTNTPSSVPDQVVVYRLPGERLGLGLKFDGGMGAQECVRRLFIQSVAPDSPAARAAVPWGELNPGDQILNIEGCAVSSMTRVQCVSFLKDAAMKITIGVLKGNGQLPDLDTCTAKSQDYIREEGEYFNNGSAHPPPLIVGEMRKRMPPPPLPPRARPRKSPARPPKDPLPPPPSGFQDLEDESSGHKVGGRSRSEDKDHPEWRELLSRRGRSGDLEELLEDLEFHLPSSWAAKRLEESIERGLPPRPSFYLDLVGEEDAAGPCESESDETSSSVSTVIDRLSLSSSTTVSRNSSFNATADASRFDLARALSPFEQLEKELETEISQEAQPASPATAPREEVASAPPIDRSTKPATTTPAPDPAPAAEAEMTTTSDKTASKTKTRSSIKSFALSLKGRPFSWQQGKNTTERVDRGSGSRGEGFLSIKRTGKRPAPPPPPRSIAGGASPSNTPPCTTSASTTPGVKETSATPDSNGNVPGNDDSYIDLVAEAAREADMQKSLSLRRNRLERQTAIDLTTEEEQGDFPTSPQSERQKPDSEYLMLLDSPTGEDQVDAVSVSASAQNDEEEKNEGDGEVGGKDSLDRPESLAISVESQAGENEEDIISHFPEGHDTSSVVEENVNVPVHEETHALTLSRSYVETQAEVHHQPREGCPGVSEVETEDLLEEVAQEDENMKVGSSQDCNTEGDDNAEFRGDEHREGSESREVCDSPVLGDAAVLDDDGGSEGNTEAVWHKLGQGTELHDTAEPKEVTDTDLEEGNVVLNSEKEETDEDVQLHNDEVDNESNDALVSEGTEPDNVSDSDELKTEENTELGVAEGGSETDVSMTEHSTRSESSMKVEGEADDEREEELLDKEAAATEGGGGGDDSGEAEGDQNIYEEIDDTTCGEDQDQDQEIFYPCSSRKHSAEHSPRDLILDVSVAGKEDPELYDDVVGPPSDQAWSESQDSSDLQGLRLSGPEEESGEQDTVDEDFESLYDDVLEGDGSSVTEGVNGSIENVYENVEESELTEDKVDEEVTNGDNVMRGDGGSVIEGVKGSTENMYENVEESELTEETEVTVDEDVVTSEASERAATTGESEASPGSVRTVTECVRHRRLRQDIGDLIRREMNLDDDVTVEVEEEEEVESTVECENEEELLLVMRALRRDQPGDSLRWLEDDSDEDEGAGGTDEGKKGTEGSGGEEEERGQDPPESAGDPQPTPPPSRGQSAQEDTEVVAARALSDPTGRRECPRSPPPSPPTLPTAAAQSPVSPASTAAAAALHSLARGTSRHPHHTAAPHHRSPPLSRPRLAGPRSADREAPVGDGLCVRAADKARTTFLTPIDETELDSTCEDSSVVVDETLEVTESAKVKDSALSEAGVPRVDAARDLEALTRPGTHHTNVPSTIAAMVARTDTNQGGKVASCPDDLQSLSVLALQGKQEMDAPLLPAVPTAAAAPLHLAPQDSEGAAGATSSGDAASDGPSTPSTFCSDGEEQDELEDEERSSENTPEPPDYSTHPDLTGK